MVWREKGALAQAAGAVFSGPICSAADNLWTSYSCAGGSPADECVAAGAIDRAAADPATASLAASTRPS